MRVAGRIGATGLEAARGFIETEASFFVALYFVFTSTLRLKVKHERRPNR
jgi:hypothetical protein